MNKVSAIVNRSYCNYGAHVIVGDGIAASIGGTLTELRQQMKEALDFHLECMKEYGDEIPKPFDEEFELVFIFDKSMFKPARRAKRIGLRKPVGKISRHKG
jgi:predicted RNase H-like HicB family nuclease